MADFRHHGQGSGHHDPDQFGRGYDTRHECPDCGHKFGRMGPAYHGRCLACTGSSWQKRYFSDKMEDNYEPKTAVGDHKRFTISSQLTNRERAGMYENKEVDGGGNEAFDFAEKVDFTDSPYKRGGDRFTNRGSWRSFARRRARRGTHEVPDHYGKKYHTEGDVGT